MGKPLSINNLGMRICLCFHRFRSTMGTCKGGLTSLGYSSFTVGKLKEQD